MDVVLPLLANVVLASLLWVLATFRRDVSLIDLLWPLFFVVAAWIWFEPASAGFTQWCVLILVMLWGGRLHIHLAHRNLGHGEDRRYQEIRHNNDPGFWWKSIFIVFLLQAALAWVASLGVYGALEQPSVTPLALIGLLVALTGFVIEAVADWQLSRFKANADNQGRVMDQGLWALSRHPNYFGEFCFWWGIYLVAMPNAWWSILSPLLLTLLLLKVSGVTLLEKDIQDRRPGYRQYIDSTPAFFPDLSKLIAGVKL